MRMGMLEDTFQINSCIDDETSLFGLKSYQSALWGFNC